MVGIVTSTLGAGQQSGSGALFSIDSVSNTDTLYLTNVQGKTFSSGSLLTHFNGTNFVALTGNKTVVETINDPIDSLHEGNVIEVSHYNHGMHSGNNKLEISNVRPTTAPVVLNAAVGLSTNVMLLDDPATGANATLSFQEFEGVPATGGFVIVNNEIMEYSSVDSNNESLYISKRGISNSAIRSMQKEV